MALVVEPLVKSLKGLEARTLEELLSQLGEFDKLRAKGEPVRLPTVTLHLRSGRDLQGVFLEQREDRGGKTVVVLHALSGDARRPQPDALFIRLEAVDAITVHEFPGLFQPAPGAPPPPTKLELRRKLAERQASLAATLGTPLELEVDWDTLPPEPEALGALDTLGARAFGVLEELTRELLGLEALRTQVRKVRLTVGPAAQVLREQQTLQLVTVVAVTGWLSKEDLRREIEKVL
jgi:hypothetical protein